VAEDANTIKATRKAHVHDAVIAHSVHRERHSGIDDDQQQDRQCRTQSQPRRQAHSPLPRQQSVLLDRNWHSLGFRQLTRLELHIDKSRWPISG
jgi:hypothetical protein